MRHLLFSTVAGAVAIKKDLGVSAGLLEDLLHLLNELLSVDCCKLIDELVPAKRSTVVFVDGTEESARLFLIKLDMHRSHLAPELGQGHGTVGVSVEQGEHHADIQVITHDVRLDFLLSSQVLLVSGVGINASFWRATCLRSHRHSLIDALFKVCR